MPAAEDGEGPRDVLATVLAAADEDGTVAWEDVDDEITVDQWGRLIERNVLVAEDDRIRFHDPEGLRAALDERPASAGSEWDGWDAFADDDHASGGGSTMGLVEAAVVAVVCGVAGVIVFGGEGGWTAPFGLNDHLGAAGTGLTVAVYGLAGWYVGRRVGGRLWAT